MFPHNKDSTERTLVIAPKILKCPVLLITAQASHEGFRRDLSRFSVHIARDCLWRAIRQEVTIDSINEIERVSHMSALYLQGLPADRWRGIRYTVTERYRGICMASSESITAGQTGNWSGNLSYPFRCLRNTNFLLDRLSR